MSGELGRDTLLQVLIDVDGKFDREGSKESKPVLSWTLSYIEIL